MTADVREEVRERYAEAAVSLSAGCGCGCDCDSIGCCGEESTTLFGQGLYAAGERASLPETAVAASLGCGNPLALVELHEGETVLDLGSGGGIDVLLSRARRPDRERVYGLDMTAEMLALAGRTPARRARPTSSSSRGSSKRAARRRERRRRDLELRRQPLAREGRGAVGRSRACCGPAGGSGSPTSSPRIGSRRPIARCAGAYVGCIAGALSVSEYRDGLRRAVSSTSTSSSPTRWPTGCTVRSCGRASPTPGSSSSDGIGYVGGGGVRRHLCEQKRARSCVHAGRPARRRDDAARPAPHAARGHRRHARTSASSRRSRTADPATSTGRSRTAWTASRSSPASTRSCMLGAPAGSTTSRT